MVARKDNFLWRGWNYMTKLIKSVLFASPSFIGGIAAVFDFGSTLTNYNYSDTAREADYNALYSDWAAVGSDIRGAVIEWELENGKK